MADYISREAAIKKHCEFCRKKAKFLYGEGCRDRCPEYKEFKEEIPAADVRPVVKAAWEDTPNPQWPAYDIRHCPCCGWSIPKSKLRAKDLDWNYCPHCGADMRPNLDTTKGDNHD